MHNRGLGRARPGNPCGADLFHTAGPMKFQTNISPFYLNLGYPFYSICELFLQKAPFLNKLRTSQVSKNEYEVLTSLISLHIGVNHITDKKKIDNTL